MKKIRKKRLLIGVIIAVIGGIIMFGLYNKAQLEKQVELERNREYEVSLVATLKNTYSGIKEVRIKDPVYSDKPSDSWGAQVTLVFYDGKHMKYTMAHDKLTKEIRSRDFKNPERVVDNNYLNSHKGKTLNSIIVYFSNGEKGEQ